MFYHNPDLEFDTLVAQISKRCNSDLGRAQSANLRPLTDLSAIKKSQALVAEIQEQLARGVNLDFSGLTNLAPLFEDSRNALFAFEEFTAVYNNNIIVEEILDPQDIWEDFPEIAIYLKKLTSFADLNVRYLQIFDTDGEILDGASKELYTIRKRINSLRMQIQKTMQSLLNDNNLERYLQDKYVTQREGRYVLPIKEGSAPFVNGIVQSQSGSKSTVFIEPMAIIPLNNELQLLKQQEKQEVFKIFTEYTAAIKAEKKRILRNQEILAFLDFRFACGRLCNTIKAKTPVMLSEPCLKLKTARHPLLILRLGSSAKVIPFDLELGEEKKIIILSGPNTGGKTVLLKATGLITLMALSGLPVPADEDSEIGFFKNIFADIGDDQSIENALSTFSAHLEKIGKMLQYANPQTLILIDEIGAATDPQQGSALAQAILERFLALNCPTIVTTHYTALKIFAEQHPKCLNASMQFDTKNLQPTYKFIAGFPGDSFAIEVAASLGIEPKLIDRAKELAGSQNVQFTELLKKMQEEKKKFSVSSYQNELKTRLLENKLQELAKKEEDWEKEVIQRRQNYLKELQQELISQQKIYQNELEELKTLSKQERKSLSEYKLHYIETKTAEIQKELNDNINDNLSPIRNPQPGTKVWLSNFDTEAVILSIEGEQAKVDMNGITFQTPVSTLFETKTKEVVIKNETKVKAYIAPKAKFELKILGLTFDEAKPLIDDFLDDATLAGLHSLRIVHGKGTGALRTKVRDYLKKKKQVISIGTPGQAEGGSGVTIVNI
jgi:DNA mismatch repair protein MutS2